MNSSSKSNYPTKSNYHTHSRWCDGKGELRAYIEEAIIRGLRAIGFSGHAPLPYPNEWTMNEGSLKLYLEELRVLQKEYRGRIEIYIGLETDYIKKVVEPSFFSQQKELRLDYTIGSVHGLIDPESGRYLSIDGPEEELRELISSPRFGTPRSVVEAYYHAVGEMISAGGFSFLGHLDLIKKLNGKLFLFDENSDWYLRAIITVLERVAEAALPIEMNTGALSRGYTDEPYPSGWILPHCRERNIPIIINSDAHRPEWVDYGFDLCREMLNKAGYSSTLMLLEGAWQQVEL
jgi:histidinol-phosphatase (PHP family)